MDFTLFKYNANNTEKPVVFDGAMGTYLQSMGYRESPPVLYNISNPGTIINIHSEYLKAGASILTTNTFDAYNFKYENYAEIIEKAISHVKSAISLNNMSGKYVAFGLGATGKLTSPLGTTPLSELYNIFKKTAILGEKYGADFVLLETMQDLGEVRAAVLAIKENTSLPIAVTMTFDANGRTLFGASALTVIAVLESLGIDAIGLNCGFGNEPADEILGSFLKYSQLPIIAQPNAGLPEIENGNPVYKLPPKGFANMMYKYAASGVRFIGGCCGTTPEHIRQIALSTQAINIENLELETATPKNEIIAASYSKHIMPSRNVCIGQIVHKLEKASNMDYHFDKLADEVLDCCDEGAELLNIVIDYQNIENGIALPIVEEYIEKAISAISSVCSTPLIISANDIVVLEYALRHYNGKAIVYGGVAAGICGLDKALPLIKKYGAAIIGLCTENNTPAAVPVTYGKSLPIAKKIVEKALAYGIPHKDIIIDMPMPLNNIKMQSTTASVTGICIGFSNSFRSGGLLNTNFFAIDLDSKLISVM